MVITAKTKLRDMAVIAPIASLANIDILEKCKAFSVPEKIRGLKPIQFYNVSMTNVAWLWDVKDPKEMLIAICEVMFYPSLPAWKRKYIYRDSEKWAKKWMLKCPLIDFYRYAFEVSELLKSAANDFAKMQVNLTEEEREAGYGQPDPESVQKMIDSFARRQGIASLEEAGNYPWSHYRFVFKNDVDEQNKQRKYNEILANKQKKKSRR